MSLGVMSVDVRTFEPSVLTNFDAVRLLRVTAPVDAILRYSGSVVPLCTEIE